VIWHNPSALKSFKTVLATFLACGLSAAGALAALADDGSQQQSSLSPASPQAQHISDLFLIILVPALLVLLIVGGMIVYAAFRFRDPGGPPKGEAHIGWSSDEQPRQLGGNNALEFTWTLVPALILLGIFTVSVLQLPYLRHTPQPEALTVHINAVRFAWLFDYPVPAGSKGKVFSSNTIYIPAGEVVNLDIDSLDVIHSWSVPRLSGRLDAVPGQHNHTFIFANEPGTYYGQCTELCGVGHAGMQVTVVAMTRADFNAWYLKKLGGH
jgi:cytochrome c oxidase subunit 2